MSIKGCAIWYPQTNSGEDQGALIIFHDPENLELMLTRSKRWQNIAPAEAKHGPSYLWPDTDLASSHALELHGHATYWMMTKVWSSIF